MAFKKMIFLILESIYTFRISYLYLWQIPNGFLIEYFTKERNFD